MRFCKLLPVIGLLAVACGLFAGCDSQGSTPSPAETEGTEITVESSTIEVPSETSNEPLGSG